MKKLLWSSRIVNLARQVQEVCRRVELRRFNAALRVTLRSSWQKKVILFNKGLLYLEVNGKVLTM